MKQVPWLFVLIMNLFIHKSSFGEVSVKFDDIAGQGFIVNFVSVHDLAQSALELLQMRLMIILLCLNFFEQLLDSLL